LGESIVAQSKSAIASCERSCVKLRDALHRWTRHSDDDSGTLAFLDRANVGFFKQSQLKTMTAAVEKCKTTLALVVTAGTLHVQLQQGRLSEETRTAILRAESRITSELSKQDTQLGELNSTLQNLVIAQQNGTRTDADRFESMGKVVANLDLLKSSMALLMDLISNIKSEAANAGLDRIQMNVSFGEHNRGQQIGHISGGTQTNTFGAA
jgi:hypothetical protein